MALTSLNSLTSPFAKAELAISPLPLNIDASSFAARTSAVLPYAQQAH